MQFFVSVRYYKKKKICYIFFVSVIHLLQFFVSVRFYKNCSNFFFFFCITFVTIFVSVHIEIFFNKRFCIIVLFVLEFLTKAFAYRFCIIVCVQFFVSVRIQISF